MKINLHIERITLEGVDWQPAQRAQFERAFTGELSRLLSSSAAPTQDRAVPFTPAPDATLPANPTPRSIGVQVAQSVFASMNDT